VEEYEKNEVLRNAINGVKKNAAINDAARTSPKKLYAGVKSRVS